jgi:hypothetical protein
MSWTRALIWSRGRRDELPHAARPADRQRAAPAATQQRAVQEDLRREVQGDQEILRLGWFEADHGDALGTIEPSKLADLCIVRGSPLQDIRNTHNVERVMVRGKLYDAPALLESVKGKMGPASAADDEWWMGSKRLGGGRGGRGGLEGQPGR